MEILNLNVRMESEKLQKFDKLCMERNTTKEIVVNELVNKLLTGEIKLKSNVTTEYSRTSFSNAVCELLKKNGAKIYFEKYEGYSFAVINDTSVMYFSFRKMNNESPVFSVRGEAIRKLKEYASRHNFIPYAVSFCYAPLGAVWVFAELGLIPDAEPKNKTESYYSSSINQTLFYRVAQLKDYQQLGELSKKSLSPELYKIFAKKFGNITK